MSYTLYTAENCHQCKEVVDYLQQSEVNFKRVNIDTSQEKPPFEVFAFPAMFLEGELVGYGTDIKNYFAKKSRV